MFKGHHAVLEKEFQTQNICNINEVIIQTQKYFFFSHNWIYKLFMIWKKKKNPIKLKKKARSPRVASAFSQSLVIYSPSRASSSTAHCISEGLSFYAHCRDAVTFMFCGVECNTAGAGAWCIWPFSLSRFFLISLSLGQPYGGERRGLFKARLALWRNTRRAPPTDREPEMDKSAKYNMHGRGAFSWAFQSQISFLQIMWRIQKICNC